MRYRSKDKSSLIIRYIVHLAEECKSADQGPVSQRASFYDDLTMYLTKFKNILTCVSQNVRKMILNNK